MRFALIGLVLVIGCTSATSSTEEFPVPTYGSSSGSSGSSYGGSSGVSGPDGNYSGPSDVTQAPTDCPPASTPSPLDQTATHAARVLVSGLTLPRTLALDLDNLYWVSSGSTGGGIFKAPKSGGTAVALYQGVLGDVDSIGIDTTSIYFPANLASSHVIAAVPTAGGPLPPRLLATGIGATHGVAVAGGYAYWVEEGQSYEGPTVKRVSVNGGTVQTMSAPLAGYDTTGGSLRTVVGPDGIYATFEDGTIDRFPLDWSKPVGFAISGNARDLAVDADNVYFEGASFVGSVSKKGGCPTFLATGQLNPRGLATDDTSVYFTDDTHGTINAVAKKGGAANVLVTQQNGPFGLVVDATTIFWANRDDGTINSVTK